LPKRPAGRLEKAVTQDSNMHAGGEFGRLGTTVEVSEQRWAGGGHGGKEHLQKFGLELHPDKTRLIEFRRNAAVDRSGEARASRKFSTFWASRTCGEDSESRQVYRQKKDDS
jgi:hypothetical protein